MKHITTLAILLCLFSSHPSQAESLFYNAPKQKQTTQPASENNQHTSNNDEEPASYQSYLDDVGIRHSLSLGLALTNLGSYAEYEYFVDRVQHVVTVGFYEYLFSGGARANTIYVGYRHFMNLQPYGAFMGGGVYQTNYRDDADYLFGINDDDNNPENYFALGAYYEQGWRLKHENVITTLQYKVGLNLSHSIKVENFTSPLFIQLGATIGFGI